VRRTNLGTGTCTTEGFDEDRHLPQAAFDVSACTDCGDGMVTGAEECDRTNLGTGMRHRRLRRRIALLHRGVRRLGVHRLRRRRAQRRRGSATAAT
jgi:hypothetical protein